MWNGTIGLTALNHALPAGLTVVPLADMAPSRLVIAWRTADPNPLVRSFVRDGVSRVPPGAPPQA